MELLETHKGNRVDGMRTICEVHRQMADQLVVRFHDRPDDLDEIIPLLNEAYRMGINLCKTLIDRKLNLPEWEFNNVKEANQLRQLRKAMVGQLNETGNLL